MRPYAVALGIVSFIQRCHGALYRRFSCLAMQMHIRYKVCGDEVKVKGTIPGRASKQNVAVRSQRSLFTLKRKVRHQWRAWVWNRTPIETRVAGRENPKWRKVNWARKAAQASGFVETDDFVSRCAHQDSQIPVTQQSWQSWKWLHS